MSSRSGLAPAAGALLLLAVTLPLTLWLRMPTLWFLAPFAVITLLGRPYADYGLTLRNPGPLALHVAIAVVVLGGYAVLHYSFAHWVLGQSFRPTLPPAPGRLLVTQFLVIGLSEEMFFRGYLQTELNRSFGRRRLFLGASWGSGLVIAALLFGLCHIVTGDLTRLRVVFFGLFAGWLRERTDTIVVPAAYHGASNILYDFMQRSLY